MPGAFPLIGSKGHLADTIISFFPPHKCYAEIFGGSGAVLLSKPPSEVEVYNDVNQDLVNFMLQVRDNLPRVQWLVDFTPYSRELYSQWTKDWKKGNIPKDPAERATRWFYLQCAAINQHFGAGWSHGATSNDAVDYHRGCNRLFDVAKRLSRVVIENSDFAKVIKTYDSEETLLYIDPPYLGTKREKEYYGTGFTRHKELAELLHKIAGKAILSYYPHPLLSELYHGWHIYPVNVTKSTGDVHGEPKEKAVELIITNYEALPLFRNINR